MILLLHYSFMLAFNGLMIIQDLLTPVNFAKCTLDCFHLSKHKKRGDLPTYILIVIVKFIETQSQILRFQHGLHFPIRQKAIIIVFRYVAKILLW